MANGFSVEPGKLREAAERIDTCAAKIQGEFKDVFERVITQITEGAVIGYKYFDFGEDFTSDPMTLCMSVRGMGTNARVKVMLDDPETGEEIGEIDIGTHDGCYKAKVKHTTGRHALYFVMTLKDTAYDWMKDYFRKKPLFEMKEFAFLK